MERLARPVDEIVPEWGREVLVSASDPWMQRALARIEEMARLHPEVSNPTAALIVKNEALLAFENGGQIHPSFCPRIGLGSPSTVDYEFCPTHCHFTNHAEARAARAARARIGEAQGTVAYLAGHYWACMPCWEELRVAGITELRLLDDAEKRYKERRGALLPRQGMLPHSLRLSIEGSFAEKQQAELLRALRKVGFDMTTRQANPGPEVVLIAPGGDAGSLRNAPTVLIVDASAQQDYRHALRLLSEETESLFEGKRV